jgi:hypothetical protein
MFRVHVGNLKDQPGVGGVYRRLTGRPAWVWGTAVLVGIAPFAIAIALLALAAIITTALVFTVLGLVDNLLQAVGSVLTGERRADNQGRENVTVIRTDESF